MRIIFHNPYNKNFFWQTFFWFITRNKMNQKTKKYLYLLEYLNKNNIKFWIYIDYNATSFPKNYKIFKNKYFIKIELFFWLLLKNIKRSNVVVIDDVNKIKKDDILISFSWENLDTDYNGLDNIIDKEFLKLFHFTHYVQRTSLVAKNFFRLKWDYIIAENNLSNIDYFLKFFKQYKKQVYQLPFQARDSFVNKVTFNNRKKIAISIGWLIDITWFEDLFDDLYNHYQERRLQPLRADILHDKKELFWIIDTPSVPLKRWWIMDMVKMFFWMSKISKYYNFDMCDKFNEYQMFLCCEEIWWLPGIWFVEWMASWCAYIWKDDDMYRSIWLLPWIHYIWHNWTLEDIVNKIKYYQSHQEELEKIAKNGENFINEHFRPDIIAEKFYNDLKNLSDNYKKCNYKKEKLIFNNSFILK